MEASLHDVSAGTGASGLAPGGLHFTALTPAEVAARSRLLQAKTKVAVVDDNDDNRLLLRAILDDQYEISEYEDGPAALAGLACDVPDLVLLDISLPGMDGVEVLAHLRSDERLKGLPVVALTAHAMSGDREKYLSAGFDGYVAKPIVDEQLVLGAIRRLLDLQPPKLSAAARTPRTGTR